jgi:hypothetical protein
MTTLEDFLSLKEFKDDDVFLFYHNGLFYCVKYSYCHDTYLLRIVSSSLSTIAEKLTFRALQQFAKEYFSEKVPDQEINNIKKEDK